MADFGSRKSQRVATFIAISVIILFAISFSVLIFVSPPLKGESFAIKIVQVKFLINWVEVSVKNVGDGAVQLQGIYLREDDSIFTYTYFVYDAIYPGDTVDLLIPFSWIPDKTYYFKVVAFGTLTEGVYKSPESGSFS